jgi:DNA topoisomerase-3
MKSLILTEKPSQAQDIVKAFKGCKKKDGYYDCGEYLITWAVGHLFEIDDSIAPQKWSFETLPILPEQFKLKLRRGVGKQFKVIKELLKKVNKVIIATDPGREGELIAREILLMAGWKDWKNTYRLWTSEALTPEVVRRALKNLRPAIEFDSLYYSALARQHSDWIVGINLTRAVSLKSKDHSVWSVGRVQTPTLAILVKREKEIENFKPEPYWVIKAIFEKQNIKFPAVLTLKKEDLKTLAEDKPTDEDEEEETKQETGTAIKDKNLALKIFNEIKNIPFGVVQNVITKRKREFSPPLHSLTSLQREANKVYGFSAQKTLNIAQKLYEERKIISYPRTDSQYLATSNKDLVKEILTALGRKDLIPAVDKVGKRVFDDSKLTDHHAIIPLKPPAKDLTEDEKKLYDLILKRFLAVFYPPYIYETTTAVIRLGNYTFVARGKVDISLGWKEVYNKKESENKLPKLQKGENVKKTDQKMEEKKTQPPPRYTEGKLLKAMEKLGLGTPATRAAIIETLKKRGYVIASKKALIPTEKGKELVEKLLNSEVSSPEMTAKWEKALENIYLRRVGYKGYRLFVDKVKEFIKNEIEKLKDKEFVANVAKGYTKNIEKTKLKRSSKYKSKSKRKSFKYRKGF